MFTTQFIVGMKALLRGWIVKHWGDLEKSQNKVMKSMNKIVIKKCVALRFIRKSGAKEMKFFTIVKIIVSLQHNGMYI